MVASTLISRFRVLPIILKLLFMAFISYGALSAKDREVYKPWSVSADNPVTREALEMKTGHEDVSGASMPVLLFRFYQKYITDLDDSRCHYYPTCSVYSMWAVRKYGLTKGVLMSTDRLIRCHTGQSESRWDPPVHY